MVKKYIPKQGDICFVDFNPTKGHEQSGYRPCLVLSIDSFNNFTKMVVVCPITSNVKEFPTHYILNKTKTIKGAVLLEHIRSLDFEERKFKFVEKISSTELDEIHDLLNVLFEIN